MANPITLLPQDPQAIDELLAVTEKRLAHLRQRVEEIKQLMAENKATHRQLSKSTAAKTRLRFASQPPVQQAAPVASTDYRIQG
ncbi:hypothetical protein [Mucilaginibacter ginsenosidivorans]|uniref:Uncharacterized protein n=1 Tax=Mucilaginibacter ginsenosidivorans TaxID=398053 RepID=A0A5B8URN9_9SPHI|nr:hypothetical protein [Mucilaginibacter ginsenosidivorans]QEC61733.1 hypothetical protein FRZ54_03750 [Mucilaginibacter ginsenosidivorans]